MESIPNSKVLTDSVTNYSTHGLSKGVAVSVNATIGYDVNWRTVHKLLLDGAARTEQIVADPAPRVLEQSFGNYSVDYELRAWTKTSEAIFETVPQSSTPKRDKDCRRSFCSRGRFRAFLISDR